GFPEVFYLKYHLYRHNFPLYALARYRNMMSGAGEYRSMLISPESLESWRAERRKAGRRRAQTLSGNGRAAIGQAGGRTNPGSNGNGNGNAGGLARAALNAAVRKYRNGNGARGSNGTEQTREKDRRGGS
ncbi:MAG TPA: hypothetical protein VEG63_10700, partial [Candidatus Acidoferrales bacterium]|nr:hypothetical protein [Candidatus Acidoferrales bacterium]